MHRIVQVLEGSNKPLQIKELWKYVVQDLDKLNDLVELMRNLATADRVQMTKDGFLPKRKIAVGQDEELVDYSLLLPQEIEI
jgi:hypothetical protein